MDAECCYVFEADRILRTLNINKSAKGIIMPKIGTVYNLNFLAKAGLKSD